MLFQHGGHAGLITAATGLVRLDRAFFKAQRDQNLARFFLLAALAALRFSECATRSGKTSDAGLALANMASVHSGFSLSIISGSGFFFIAFYLRFVGAAQADHPHRRTGFGQDQSMKAVPDITEREKAGFAVAAGRYDQGCGPIEFSGSVNGRPLSQMFFAFFAGSKSIFII